MKGYLRFYLEINEAGGRSSERPGLPSFSQLEKDYILYLLDLTEHDLGETARILNISKVSLDHRLSRYRIVVLPACSSRPGTDLCS